MYSNSDIREVFLKKLSYFGYLSIKIIDSKFYMFSNGDDPIVQEIFWFGVDTYENTSLKIWSILAKQSKNMIDVGAYSGIYSLAAASNNRKCKIYAFEALDRIYYRLLLNKMVNKFANINTYNLAISENKNIKDLYVYSGETILVTGSSVIDLNLDRDIYEVKKVNSISLDLFVNEKNINRVDAIKIDVEGAENSVLQGAKEIILNYSPDIIVEILPFSLIDNTHYIFSELGYNSYIIDEENCKIIREEFLTRSDGIKNLNRFLTLRSEKELIDIFGKDFLF